MPRKIRCCMFFCIWYWGLPIVLAAVHLPFDSEKLHSFHHYLNRQEHNFQFSLQINSRGTIYAMEAGNVIVSKQGMVQSMGYSVLENNTPLVVIETDQGFHIAYQNVEILVLLGQKVAEGDPIAIGNGNWTLRVFDTRKQQWVDPLVFFPNSEGDFQARIFDLSFHYHARDDLVLSITDAAHYAGSCDMELLFELRNTLSGGYLIPDSITVDIGNNSHAVMRKDMLRALRYDVLERTGRFALRIPGLVMPPGYVSIRLTVDSSVMKSRVFVFSLFAAPIDNTE